MSYETTQVMDLEALHAEFDDAIINRDKKTAFRIMKQMEQIGLSVEAQDKFEDILMRLVPNTEPLLGSGYSPEITQEDMNGGFIGIDKGNYD